MVLARPSLVDTLTQGVELLKPHVKKLDHVTVAVLTASIFVAGTTLSVKARRWRPIFIYLTAILLITPYLPHVEIFVAKFFKTTLRSLGSYIQMVTLSAMGFVLLLSLL